MVHLIPTVPRDFSDTRETINVEWINDLIIWKKYHILSRIVRQQYFHYTSVKWQVLLYSLKYSWDIGSLFCYIKVRIYQKSEYKCNVGVALNAIIIGSQKYNS